MTSPTQQLERIVEDAARRLQAHPPARAVLSGEADAKSLARYYHTAHCTVRQATALLRQSHDKLERDGGDPALVELLRHKASEEAGHERWLEDDLRVIGLPLGHPALPQPTPAAAAYNAFHQHIIDLEGHAFLGTAFVLEALAVRCAGVAADRLRASGRIQGLQPGDARGVSFLTLHNEADVGHTAEMADLLERHVRGERPRDYVLLCASFTATIYPAFFG